MHSSIYVYAHANAQRKKVQMYTCTATLTWEDISASSFFFFCSFLFRKKIAKWMDTSVGSFHTGCVKPVGFNLKWKTTPQQRRCSLCICSPSSSSFTMRALLMGHARTRSRLHPHFFFTPSACIWQRWQWNWVLYPPISLKHRHKSQTPVAVNKCCTWLRLASL